MEHEIVQVGADALRHHCAEVLRGHGLPAADAEVVADNLVEADLRGVDSHGANLLALYVSRLRSGAIPPVAEVTVVRDDGSTVLLDGGLGFGQVAGLHAVELAVARAQAHGVATVAVRESTHLGALGYYTRRAAERGVIALAFQNGPTIVPPYGGTTQLFSTNPLSYAVPAAEERPVVYDIATTTVAGNKVLLAKKRGDATIPDGWANDDQGRPTNDTEAASVHHLQWFGGHKGYGLALLVEVLAGALAGSCFGRTEDTRSELHGKERVAKGYAFITIDPARFAAPGEFQRRIDALVRDIHASEPAAGVARVLVPGELEDRRQAEREASGIPLSAGLVAELDALGAPLQLPALGGSPSPAR